MAFKIRQHVVELQIHLRERLLHVLNTARGVLLESIPLSHVRTKLANGGGG